MGWIEDFLAADEEGRERLMGEARTTLVEGAQGLVGGTPEEIKADREDIDRKAELNKMTRPAETTSSRADVMARLMEAEAIGGMDMHPSLRPYVGYGLEPEKSAQMKEYMARRGSSDITGGGEKGPSMGTNVAAARRIPGARTIAVEGDEVVIGKNGELLAVGGGPEVLEQVNQMLEPESDVGVLSTVFNVLNTPNRVATSAANAAQLGQDPLTAAGDAFWNEGEKVNPWQGGQGPAAGLTTQGWGDYLRNRGRMLLAENPDATVEDLLGYLTPPGVNREARLDTFDDEMFEQIGTIGDIVLDPLNFIPSAVITKPVGAAAGAAGKVARATPGVRRVVGKVDDAAEALVKWAGAPRTKRAMAKVAKESLGMDDAAAKEFAKRMYAVKPEKLASALSDAAADERTIAEAMVLLTKDQGPELIAKIERGLTHVDDATAVKRLLSVPDATLEKWGTKWGGMVRKAKKTGDFAELLDNRWQLAGKFGVNLFNEASDDALTVASKRVASMFAKHGEEMKQLGLIPKSTSLQGYYPRMLKGTDAFMPLRSRLLVPTHNVNELMAAARELTERPKLFGQLDEANKSLVNAFSDGKKLQYIGDPKNQEALKGVLKEAGQLYDEVDDVIGATDNLLKEKGRLVFEKDEPQKVIGKYLSVINPIKARARIARDLLSLTDEAGNRLIMTRPEALKAIGKTDLEDGFRPLFKKTAALGKYELKPEVARALREAGMVRADDAVLRKLPMLKGMWMKAELADEVATMAGSFDPKMFEKAGRFIGRMTKYWVPFQLATPGFHIRNAIYGEMQLYLALGPRYFNPLHLRTAHKLAAAAQYGKGIRGKIRLGRAAAKKLGTKELRLADLVEEMAERGVAETGLVADLQRVLKTQAPFKNERALRAWNAAKPTKFFNKGINEQILGRIVGGGGGMTGATVENVQRARLYLARRLAGDSALDASLYVKKYMFDYTGGRLSDLEKGVRQFAPFYQWLRYSTEQAVEMMWAQPNRYMHIHRLFNLLDSMSSDKPEDPRMVPEHLRTRSAIRVPDFVEGPLEEGLSQLGIEPREGTRRRWSPERPGQQLEIFKPGNTLDMLGQQLGVPAKMYMETVGTHGPGGTGGRYLFGGGEISPGFVPRDANALERFLNMKQDRMIPYFSSAVGGPWGSLTSQALGMRQSPRMTGQDQDERMLYSLLSTLLGQRFTAYDPGQVAGYRALDDKGKLQSMERARRKSGEEAMTHGPANLSISELLELLKENR